MIAALLLALLACGNEGEPSATAPSPASAPAQPTTSAPMAAETQLAPATREAADQVLAAYERVRAALAKDSLEGVSQAAEEIAAHARTARGTAPAELHARLDALAQKAEGLKSAADIGAARETFGELSREVVALIAASPALAEGRHVFACPMAQPYGKWVQPSPKLENPYMGTKMPGCGMASDWTP